MRALILVAGAALALSACSGGTTEQNEVDTLAGDNLVVDNSAAGMTGDMNALDANAMGGLDANTANAVATDMNTNDPDTNLANGM